jgi:hypothetical protein
MVGDYISTSIVNGRAWPTFAIATAPSGSTFNEPMAVPAGGLPIGAGAVQAATAPAVVVGHRPAPHAPLRVR